MILIFGFSLLVSFYHFGIEQGLFEESSVCGLKGNLNIQSKEEILKELRNQIISCKDVTFKIFGFSLTTYNILLSLILLIILTNIYKNYGKFKKKG